MATAQVVITYANEDTPAVGGLFEGLKFFLVQRLPSRSSFIQKIEANGGRVVKLENQADHIIADHFRKDCPAGSISYTFIDVAIRDGKLPALDDHAAGPPQGTIREAGSAIPGKSTRTPFTAEDDRVLRQWVERCKAGGALVKGNEIYKQLEARNDRHTFQAWRDRYIKKLMDQPPAGVELKVAANAPPSPPTVQDEQEVPSAEPSSPSQKRSTPRRRLEKEILESRFTEEDHELLMEQASDIEFIAQDQLDDAWIAWSSAYPEHTAQSWRTFWEDFVRPVYLRSSMNEKVTQQKGQIAQNRLKLTEHFDVEDDKAEPDINEQTVELPEAVPARAAPSSLQKRKRKTNTSHADGMYHHKRPKSNSERSSQQDKPNEEPAAETTLNNTRSPAKPSTQVIEIVSSSDEDREEDGLALPTSDLNRAAQTQLQREDQNVVEDVMPTSDHDMDSQATAQARFDEEGFGVSRADARTDVNTALNFPTSEVNREADQQLRRESVDRHDAMEEEDASSLPQTANLQSSGVKDPSQSQVLRGDAVNVMEATGAALTEANLASQQAQHKAQLLRSADLPEDNEAEDGEAQDNYIEFLQSVTRQSGGIQSPSAAALPELRKGEARETDGLRSTWQVGQVDLEPEQIDELPVSSQQELDVAIDDIIQWPESPAMSQRKDLPSPSRGLETEVSYPHLPQQHVVQSQEQNVASYSSQASLPSQIAYPPLPQPRLEPPDVRETQDGYMSSQLPASNQPRSIQQESSYLLVREGSPQSSQGERGEDELDLTIAVPDGGWDGSSSPSKMLNSSPARQLRSPQHIANGPMPQLSEDSESDAVIVEQVNDVAAEQVHDVARTISSSSSSSSAYDEMSNPAIQLEESRQGQKRALDTQDIINAETQVPDFDIPLPPDSDDEPDELSSDSIKPNSSPPNATTVESQRTLAHTQTLPDDELGTYIDTMVLRGYKESSVIAALKCTSMRPDLAELVLLDEKSGKGLPKDIAGIWSEDEDRIVESGNARGLRKLDEKHTWKEVEERMLFLQEWREEE